MRIVIDSIRDALSLLEGQVRWKWLVLVLLATIVTLLEAAAAVLVYALVSLMTQADVQLDLPVLGDISRWLPDMSTDDLRLWLVAFVIAFFLARAIVVTVQEYAQARVIERGSARVATRLVHGYLAMPYQYHLVRSSSELVRNAFDSTIQLSTQVLYPLVRIVSESILVLGMSVILIAVSPASTALAFVILAPVVWLVMRVVQPRLENLGIVSQKARAESIQALQQALGGFRDIRLLRSEATFAASFERARLELSRSLYLRQTYASLPRALVETALVIVIGAIFLLTTLAGASVEAVAGILGAFAYVAFRLQLSLRQIAQLANELRFGSAVLEDLQRDLRETSDAQWVPTPRASVPDEPFQHSVRLHDVAFSYGRRAGHALDGIDVTIRKGEFIGICGPTGGGKSTLVDLLIGLLAPSSGAVTIDGESMAGRERWWQAQLGVVSQNIYLTDDTLANNITFGRQPGNGDSDDLSALDEAVDAAQLHDVVAQLPDGLDTIVGERGIRLSGGQRQRVAIARALYRRPPVVVFDEGTSALDGATEGAVVDALQELQDGRTLIAIAHRLSTLKTADYIIVLDRGRIVEQGTYDELLSTGEFFRSLA